MASTCVISVASYLLVPGITCTSTQSAIGCQAGCLCLAAAAVLDFFLSGTGTMLWTPPLLRARSQLSVEQNELIKTIVGLVKSDSPD